MEGNGDLGLRADIDMADLGEFRRNSVGRFPYQRLSRHTGTSPATTVIQST